MKFKIGFSAEPEAPAVPAPKHGGGRSADPLKSLVRVYFPQRNTTLSYYNDAFDLRRGDLVFVEGKLAGVQGRVVDISYNFKIKLSDYKRVISFADTDVYGVFHAAGSHMVTFDREAIPFEKVRTWFLPPETEEETYVSSRDGSAISLSDLSGLNASPEVFHRGQDYYRENRVSYLSLEGYHGHAIVEGTRPYDVEFEYADGEILNMVCPCFCAFPCKHEVAVLLQLKETLELIEKRYADAFAQTGCFAAVSRETFFSYAMGAREDLTLKLS